MPPIVLIVIGLAVLVLVIVVVSRSRRSTDGVDSFRRQIDALSPEARRPVIDQVHNAAERNEPRIDPRLEPRTLGSADTSPEGTTSGESNQATGPGGDDEQGDGDERAGSDEDGAHGA